MCSSDLLQRATKLIDLYSNPEVVKNLNNTLVKTSAAAEDFSRLSKSLDRVTNDFSKLPKTVETELSNLSAKANVLTASFDRTSTKIGQSADKFTVTAAQLTATAAEYKQLAGSVNSLVAENRKTFASSLNNFDKLSVDLRKTVKTIDPSIVKLNTTLSKLNSDKLVKDLEGVLSNANQTSVNLKNITANLNDPKTLVTLQQTLDSARSTFQNTQKITADLDDLTGSPEFRNNLRNLVNGLGKLVSSTEQLEQQAKLAQTIEPLSKSLGNISQLPAQDSSVSPNYFSPERQEKLLIPAELLQPNSRFRKAEATPTLPTPTPKNNLKLTPILTPQN